MVTRLELEEIKKRVWPFTHIATPYRMPNGGWSFEIVQAGTITRVHSVDSNGHPTCHEECKQREATI